MPFHQNLDRLFVAALPAKTSPGLGICLGSLVAMAFAQIGLGQAHANFGVIRVKKCDLLPHRERLDPPPALLVVFGKRGVMCPRFRKRAFELVKFGKFRRNLDRFGLQP